MNMNKNKFAQIECDLSLPYTGDYTFEIFITSSSHSRAGYIASCYYNVELKQP